MGGPDLHSLGRLGQKRPGCPVPSLSAPTCLRGAQDQGLFSLAPWAPGPVLLESCSQVLAPEDSRAHRPPPGAPFSPRPRPVGAPALPRARPTGCGALSPGAPPPLVTLGDRRPHCPSCGPARVPAERLSAREGSRLSGAGLSFPQAPAPLARLLGGSSPTGFLFMFFCLPTLLEPKAFSL